MAISPTGGRNLWACVTRAMRVSWYGAPSAGDEAPPIALNNESLRAPNAANTAYVNMIKVNTGDAVELPNAVLPTGGITPIAGAVPEGIWAANYPPATATSGNNTTPTANQQYIAPVWVPANMTVTGLAYLIGTVGGTDKSITALYNNAGVLVANSSVTTSGATVGTAANLQALDFTTPYAALGPARYWATVQISGTTARLMTIPAQVSVAHVGTKTNATATPATSITAPTAFTANVGPVIVAY